MHRGIDSYIALRRISLTVWAAFKVIMVVGLLLSWMALSAHAAAPAVTNISPQQRAGTKLVDITYDVSAVTPTVTVSLRISADDGATFTVPATSLSGAIGAGIMTGTGKVITWNAGADWARNYSTTMRFEVTADDGLTPPSITTQPASSAIVSGSAATLTVAASGTEPLTYQWYQGAVGDTATPVGTNSANFTSPALIASTSYWVQVSNSDGTQISGLAKVTVIPPDLALIPLGNFTMGQTSGDNISDAPSVTVHVDAFYLGKHEVNRALWNQVRSWAVTNGYSDLAVGAGKANNHPVHSVSWWDAIKWCNARSQSEGLSPCYTVNGLVMKTGFTVPDVNWTANGYRLPTEAEWEKAARGAVTGKRFPWGEDTISHSNANYYAINTSNGNVTSSYDLSRNVNSWHPTYSGSSPYTSPVGSFAENGYGLYDVAGNVWEWCWDWYGESAYLNEAINPLGMTSGNNRSRRGGSYGHFAYHARAAHREHDLPSHTSNQIGFRFARSSIP